MDKNIFQEVESHMKKVFDLELRRVKDMLKKKKEDERFEYEVQDEKTINQVYSAAPYLK